MSSKCEGEDVRRSPSDISQSSPNTADNDKSSPPERKRKLSSRFSLRSLFYHPVIINPPGRRSSKKDKRCKGNRILSSAAK